MLGSKPFETFQQWNKDKYGPVISVKMGSYPTVVLNDAKIIKDALNQNSLTGRPKIKFFMDRSGGTAKGILFTDGHKWLEQRRFALRQLRDFGFGRKSMESIIAEEAVELAERLQSHCGKPMSIQMAFNAAILNALWSLLTGERFKQDDPDLAATLNILTTSVQENNTIQGVATFLPFIAKWFPNLSGYTRMMRDVPLVTDFVWKTIPYHEETFQEGVKRDFLDVYIDEVRKTKDPNSPFHKSNSEMNWVLIDLFIAGTETTSTTLSWTFLYMAKYQAVQKKLHEEIDRVVGPSRQPCLNDRNEMHYTQAVMHEVMRDSTLVPFALFHNTTEDTEIGGYFVPKDTLIIPNIHAVHHDADVWGDLDFRPERFLNEKGEFQRHENFMAFSTGKRVCLGEGLARDEYFLFLTTLFQKFHVSVDGEINMEGFVGLVLSPKPHKFILKERM
ncbi:methyl farnesoate epoxidase isoform X2 [Folsomia candida]|nr:methyl farnesoate epoxidase isoform X2 [Folsomia candida]